MVFSLLHRWSFVVSIGDLISSLDHGFESYSAQLLLPFHSLLHESAFLDLDHRQMLQKDPFFASWHLSSSAANLWLVSVHLLWSFLVILASLFQSSSSPAHHVFFSSPLPLFSSSFSSITHWVVLSYPRFAPSIPLFSSSLHHSLSGGRQQ